MNQRNESIVGRENWREIKERGGNEMGCCGSNGGTGREWELK